MNAAWWVIMWLSPFECRQRYRRLAPMRGSAIGRRHWRPVPVHRLGIVEEENLHNRYAQGAAVDPRKIEQAGPLRPEVRGQRVLNATLVTLPASAGRCRCPGWPRQPPPATSPSRANSRASVRWQRSLRCLRLPPRTAGDRNARAPTPLAQTHPPAPMPRGMVRAPVVSGG